MSLKDTAVYIMSAATLLVWANSLVAQTKAGPECLSYAPAIITLKGTIVRRAFPGPPNYESVKKGDPAETYWLLDLPAPICVNEDRAEPDLNPAHKAIGEIQLVLQPDQYQRHEALVGRKVVATGTLFGEHTGHHHTPILLTVSTLNEASQ